MLASWFSLHKQLDSASCVITLVHSMSFLLILSLLYCSEKKCQVIIPSYHSTPYTHVCLKQLLPTLHDHLHSIQVIL